MAVTMAVSIVTALTLGAVTNQARHQSIGLGVMTACGGAGLAGLWLAPTTAPWLWAALLGIGVSVLASALASALALPALRATCHAHAIRLSAMTQAVGYAIAAFGPAAISLTSPATGLALLLACTGLQLVLAVPVGRAHIIQSR